MGSRSCSCPTTLAEFGEIKRELDSWGDQVTFMFVSVDASRDTPAVVEAFVNRFDEDFVGLTGSEDRVRSYASDYFLSFKRASAKNSASGYLVDHTSYSYLIDPDGRLNAIPLRYRYQHSRPGSRTTPGAMTWLSRPL